MSNLEKQSLQQQSGIVYSMRVNLMHPQNALRFGIETAVPVFVASRPSDPSNLYLNKEGTPLIFNVGKTLSLEENSPGFELQQRTNPTTSEISGFLAIIDPVGRMVEKGTYLETSRVIVRQIRAGCIDYGSHFRNPMFPNTQSAPEEMQKGVLIGKHEIPDRGLLEPLCIPKHPVENFGFQFKFEITPDGQYVFC